jgi:hypothetical protein
MILRARLYYALVLGAASVVALMSLADFRPPEASWFILILLAALTTLSYFARVAGAGHESWRANFVFFFAGLLLLPPPLFVVLVIFPHTIEWIEERRARRTFFTEKHNQPFNIAAHILAGLTARRVMLAIHPSFDFIEPPGMLAVLTAAVLYVGLNRLLRATALVLERSVPLRDSGIFDPESLFTDFVLALMGYIVAVLWRVAPWLVALSLMPLVLIYRALTVPQLRRGQR